MCAQCAIFSRKGGLEKCRLTEHRFGTITGKYILYRGAETVIDDIHYVNSEEYLKSLHN